MTSDERTDDVTATRSPTRRQLMKTVAAVGVGTAVFQRALVAQAQQQPQSGVTAEMIKQAAWICGIELSDADRERLAQGLGQTIRSFEQLRGIKLDNGVPPAVQ